MTTYDADEFDSSTFTLCPECGHKEEDAWELKMEDGEVQEIECGRCGYVYEVELNITCTYSSRRRKVPT